VTGDVNCGPPLQRLSKLTIVERPPYGRLLPVCVVGVLACNIRSAGLMTCMQLVDVQRNTWVGTYCIPLQTRATALSNSYKLIADDQELVGLVEGVSLVYQVDVSVRSL
jgi:hypothetical protein